MAMTSIYTTLECIFCGAPTDSEEHIWSDWTTTLYRDICSHSRITATWEVAGTKDARRLQAVNVTAQVVCRTCNTGWMSALETPMRSALERVTARTGALVLLRSIELGAVRRWIYLKALILDGCQPTRICLQTDRDAFRTSGLVPDTTFTWIVRYSGDACTWLVRGDPLELEQGSGQAWIASLTIGDAAIQCLITPAHMGLQVGSDSASAGRIDESTSRWVVPDATAVDDFDTFARRFLAP